MARQRRGGEAGVTLTEILAVVAILGILMLIAIPNFNAMMKAYRASTAVQEMVSVLERGRQLAVTKREAHSFVVVGTPTNSWTLTNTVTGAVVDTGVMPTGVSVAIAPGSAYAFNSNGGCTTPTTYTGTTPATQYVRIDATIQETRVDRFTVEVSPVGRVKSTLEHMS
jgi:prepilin-type N-terminal cleavage/methylation domain-containing protein